MTDEEPDLTPEQADEVLAAELALGLLEGDEAAAAVTRLGSDPAFAQAVRDWQERLATLAEGLTPVMPPARARQRIRETLGHGVAPLSVDPTERPAWWRGPLGAILGLAAVAAVAAYLLLPGVPTDQPAGPSYQAELVSDDQALRLAANLVGRDLEVSLQSGGPEPGRDLQMWWIAGEGATPVSLGLAPRTGTSTVTLPDDIQPVAGATVAISDEPEGGSPTGQPTGAVLAAAPLVQS